MVEGEEEGEFYNKIWTKDTIVIIDQDIIFSEAQLKGAHECRSQADFWDWCAKHWQEPVQRCRISGDYDDRSHWNWWKAKMDVVSHAKVQ